MTDKTGGPATDRELLEMAAKAAGFSAISFEDGVEICHSGWWSSWNPLTDAGDRYRLAKTLCLCVDFYARSVAYQIDGDDFVIEWIDPDGDARAIVRAAAAIGSAM